jgi:hypothetical protein
LPSNAQVKCGTHGPNPYATGTSGQSFMPGYFGCEYIKKTDRTLSITVHIAQDSLGNTGYNEANLVEPIEFLNETFSSIGLSFKICEVREMENFQFDEFIREDELDQVESMYFQQNTINLYLVESIEVPVLGQVGGFAFFPGGPDIVFVTKESMQGQSDVLIHEMGHFFGLFHTFETEPLGVEALELVDGSNCETSGDLVCDTEADPNDDADNNPAPDCNYNGSPVADTNGDFYVPPTNNFMSYYSNDCTCRFTPQQYNRMLEQYLNIRNYLW